MTPKSLGFKAIDVHFGTFDFELHCIVGPRKNVLKYVRWKMSDDEVTWSYDNRGSCFCRDGYQPIIWIPGKPKTSREYGTLAHEVFHVVRHMFGDWAGMPLSRDSEEAYAHAISYAVTKILDATK